MFQREGEYRTAGLVTDLFLSFEPCKPSLVVTQNKNYELEN